MQNYSTVIKRTTRVHVGIRTKQKNQLKSNLFIRFMHSYNYMRFVK